MTSTEPIAAAMGARIVVAIPTYRSPAALRRLLRSLRTELDSTVAARAWGVYVVVADGAADLVTARLVREYLAGVPATVVAVTSSRRAVLCNALVRTAARVCPQYRWIVMLDDDCRVVPGWFEALVGELTRAAGGVVAGPVREQVPGRAPRGVHPVFQSAPLDGDGGVRVLRHARNIAVHRSVLDAMTQSQDARWFDDKQDRTAVDYDFLLRARRVGAQVTWCPRAGVVRTVPLPERSGLARLRHAYRVDRAGALLECEYEGPAASARVVGTVCRDAVDRSGIALRERDSDSMLRAGVGVVQALGRMFGLLDGAGRHLVLRLRQARAQVPGDAVLNPVGVRQGV